VTPAAEVIELFLPLLLERRQRRVDVRQRTAGIDRCRQLPDLHRRKDLPLELGNGLEEVLGRLNRWLHVLVHGPQCLCLERGSRTVLLIRRGVLQHVQRCYGAGERHVRRSGVGGQAHA
jgi:hypothetical protein